MDKDIDLYRSREVSSKSSVSKLSSDNPELFEVTPIESKTSWRGVLITYKRIKMENLGSRDVLSRLFELVNASQSLHIIETPNYLISQYGIKPPLYLSKSDGKIYSSYNLGFDKRMIEHQASIMITILNKMNLVEDLHYHNVSLKMEEKTKIKRDSSHQEVYKPENINS